MAFLRHGQTASIFKLLGSQTARKRMSARHLEVAYTSGSSSDPHRRRHGALPPTSRITPLYQSMVLIGS